MFNVYIERDIFEDICLFDDYPNWKKILSKQTEILLNISQEELDAELLDDESPIFLFQNANAAASIPIALDSQFRALKGDLDNVLDHSRDAFIFDISPEEAEQASKDYGTAIFSSAALDDNYFKGGFFKEVSNGQVISGGWQSLISLDLPVSNSLIVSDEYLFENEEGGKNCGLANLPNLVDALLPEYLNTEYHITIVAPTGGKSKKWWEREFGCLKAKIAQLRDYEIKLEMIFTNTVHKRRLISNYFNGWADKGFSMFKVNNYDKVRAENDINIYRIFDNIENEGITHFDSATNGISQIKEICQSVSQYISNQGQSENGMVFGDCNSDKTPSNRLLN